MEDSAGMTAEEEEDGMLETWAGAELDWMVLGVGGEGVACVADVTLVELRGCDGRGLDAVEI